MMKKSVTNISEGWVFKETPEPDSAYLPVAQFPTNVHLDLLKHNKIPDPFFAKNELQVQWVGERSWDYKVVFKTPKVPEGAKAVLVFEGLDTYATVKLNGEEVHKSDNMFVGYRVDVSKTLKKEGEENSLEITFESAFLKGKELKDEFKGHKWGCWNGDESRLAVRKAQYHYGWDWGPTLLTAGPWRPVYLEVFESRIDDLYFQVDVPESLKDVTVDAKAEVEGSASKVKFDLSYEGKVVASETSDVKGGVASAKLAVEKPELWYPVGYGKQPLYTLVATLLDGDSEVDSQSKRLGLRRARLVQRPLVDQPGKTFFFEVNNIRLFCGGSNWIPADNFIPRITEQKYRDWLQLMVDGNQIMVRVWGGGIYEEQVFYDICDELGLLVWQDFAFGCGNYPAFPAFLKSVEEEAIYNVKRIRHHPSIVIYAGNNEDYQFQESENLDYDPNDKNPENWLKGTFPARYIYEKILADVTAKYTPDVHYSYGSPIGGKGIGNATTTDPTNGDLHQWNVWHQQQLKYQDFDKLAGRFVSEFGMEGFPHIKTIDSYLPKDSPERYAQSSTIDFHNKADGHERRIALYLVENFRYSFTPLESYIYFTQLMQAECLSTAYNLWRRNWKGEGREYTAGALVWQINDCWPVTSWAIVDYYLRPKPAYYTIRRELHPLIVSAKRREEKIPKNPHTRVDIETRNLLEIWSSNLATSEVTDLTLHVTAFHAQTGKELKSHSLKTFTQPENATTELVTLNIADYTTEEYPDHTQIVFGIYLKNSSGEIVARRVDWSQPLKYVHTFPKTEDINISVEGNVVKASAKVPVKGLVFESDEGHFEDQMVDLVPGETVEVKVRGLKGNVKGRWYGMDL